MPTDTERLEWLADQSGVALIHDDFGNWTVCFDGMQNVPNPIPEQGEPADISTSFFIEAKDWKPTIWEAIDAAMDGHDAIVGPTALSEPG